MPFDPVTPTPTPIDCREVAAKMREVIKMYPKQAIDWFYDASSPYDSACAIACLAIAMEDVKTPMGLATKVLNCDSTKPMAYYPILYAYSEGTGLANAICYDNNRGVTREAIADRIEALGVINV